MSELLRLLSGMPDSDDQAATTVSERASEVLRPTGAFNALDEVAVWLARWQGTGEPSVRAPHAIIFAADHGVAAEGVSAYPAQITAEMQEAIQRGVATVSVLAHEVGATFKVIDVGVGRPTGNFRVEDAMSAERFDEAVKAGAAAVNAADADLLVVGEVGIGNTSAAAAVAAACVGGEPSMWVGPGTGVQDEALDRKRRVVAEAVERIGEAAPLEALRRVGGAELAAMAGAVAAARQRRLPVLLDGYVATAAVLPLAACLLYTSPSPRDS